MSRKVDVITSLIDELERAGLYYALGGAIAYSAWAEPRATRDVDLNIWLDIEHFDPAFDALERCGVVLERAVGDDDERIGNWDDLVRRYGHST